MNQQKSKYIISGGGTGGHIYPAIAIANALREKEPDCDILFIGAKGKMEMEKVPQAGYPIVGLWIAGFQRKLSAKNLLFPFKLIVSLLHACFVIVKFKPNAVIGVGGFASGPTLRMAEMMGFPIMIQEQNSMPGMTNRILGGKARRVCVAYPGLEKYFPKGRIELTGNPVRKDILELSDKRQKAAAYYGLDADKPTLLIVGGSLGARSVNIAIEKHLSDLENLGVQVIWQTGKNYSFQGQLPNGIKSFVFLDKMDLAYALADVVVSRAGALAVSELALVKVPSILIPYPYASEDHQTKNAQALVDGGAALMVPDDQVQNQLFDQIQFLFSNEEKRSELKKNIEDFGYPNSANRIAEIIQEIKR